MNRIRNENFRGPMHILDVVHNRQDLEGLVMYEGGIMKILVRG